MAMVKDYAIIENDVVVNRIVADENFMSAHYSEYTDDPAAQIGATLIDGEWVMSEPEEEE
jgi:hypothetical protein